MALFGLGGMLYMALARHLIARLGEAGLVAVGVGVLSLCTWVLGFTPHWAPAAVASLVAGFGFFMFHNTMQINAAQMAPAARGTAVSLFAMALFTSQSIGAMRSCIWSEDIARITDFVPYHLLDHHLSRGLSPAVLARALAPVPCPDLAEHCPGLILVFEAHAERPLVVAAGVDIVPEWPGLGVETEGLALGARQ